MSLYQRIFGSKKEPAALETIDDVNAAMNKLRGERESNARRHAELIEQRRDLIDADAPDAKLIALDRELESLALADERLDNLEPKLHQRLRDHLDAERLRLLATLEKEYDLAVSALDAAMAAILDPLENYLEIIRQIDAAGFTAEARGFVTAPPLTGGGVVCSRETIELFRRERERLADMRARTARGESLSRPIAATVVPLRKPAPVSAPAPTKPRRAALKEPSAPAYGFCKVVIVRDGVEINGRAMIAGDQLTLRMDAAESLARSGGCDIVERGSIENAAE